LATSNFQIIFYGQRVGDVRVQDDKINTLQARMGTGGNNMPMVAEVLAFDSYNQSISETSQTIRKGAAGNDHIGMVFEPFGFSAGQGAQARSLAITKDGTPPLKAMAGGNSIPSVMANQSTVRRLTPTECERLQGFPDGWTEGQADSHRYKQMGNAVAVPVVEWILARMLI